MAKTPSFQWYPADRRGDPALRMCSLAARGLWDEMLCIMHEGEPYGHLRIKGIVLDDSMLSRMVGASVREVKACREQLEKNGVFSRTEEGVIFSRRMVRDESFREIRRIGGKEGGRFGILGAPHGKNGGRPKTPHGGGFKTPLPFDGKPPSEPPPSSSSSSSSSKGEPSVPPPAVDHENPPPPKSWSSEACDLWARHRGGLGRSAGRICAALKPLVDEQGWENVRTHWEIWISEGEARFHTIDVFAANFLAIRDGRWDRSAGKPQARRNGMLDGIDRLEKRLSTTVDVEVVDGVK